MIPWTLLETAQAPGGRQELRLLRRGAEFSIALGRDELMNSRVKGSEEALAALACGRIASCAEPRVLIGGLGMGFTLAAALRALGPKARVTVAEIAPAVAAWARGPLAHLSGRGLEDARVDLRQADVAELMRSEPSAYDAILLDVDNGPDGLTRPSNDWLYGAMGLRTAGAALRRGGVLAVWSARPDKAFTQRLRNAAFLTEEIAVRANGARGARHMVWIATQPDRA